MPQGPDEAKLAVWRKRLQEFERGNETIEQFCRRTGVTSRCFYYRRGKVTRLAKSGLGARGTTRDLSLEQAWRDRIERQQQSGLRIPAFCQQHGLVAQQFYWWRHELERRASEVARTQKSSLRLKKAKRTSDADAPRFVPVRVATNPQTSSHIEIVLDQPWRIALKEGFNSDVLVELLRVLERRSC
jgi:hypothetical protein